MLEKREMVSMRKKNCNTHQAMMLVSEGITLCVLMYLSYSAIQGCKKSDSLPSRSSLTSESVSTLWQTNQLMCEFDWDGAGFEDFLGKISNTYLSDN